MNFTELAALLIAQHQPHSESVFTTPGTHSFAVPVNVSSISVVCVGGGGAGGRNNGTTNGGAGGGGGALAYVNNIPVSESQLFQIVVASSSAANVTVGGTGASGSDSWFTGSIPGSGPFLVYAQCGAGGQGGTVGTTTLGGQGGRVISGSGGNGGKGGGGTASAGGGGGGGGGYSGNGGNGSGAGAGGGGGGGGTNATTSNANGGGGGVNVFGEGVSGAAGGTANPPTGGAGGSGGQGGLTSTASGSGGTYGGGGGGQNDAGLIANHYGAQGAVRIIWPGNTRQFPSACYKGAIS